MYKKLQEARDEGHGTIAYLFADGTKLVSQINPKVFFDDKGRKRKLDNVVDIFNSIRHDLKAISFEI